MIEDPIVAEVRKSRKALAERHGNDLRRLVEFLRQMQKESERQVLNPGPRPRLHETGS
jgi:hypothetical protein